MIIQKAVEFLMKWCEKRGKVVHITGTAGPDDVYMVRHLVLKSRFCNIYIHQFLRSDRDDLHDHPWNFLTYLVHGAYTENKWNEETKQIEQTRRSASEYCEVVDGTVYPNLNRLVFRRATDQHQVVVDRDLKLSEKNEAALTLFISGPIMREWGFIKNVTPQNDGVTPISEKYLPIRKWIPWREYLGLPSNTPPR